MPQNTPPQDSPQETTRRVENLARYGTVVAVRHGKPARCRVKTGDNTTDWIQWFACRAGGETGRMWWPPAVGEQCLVLSPGGDLSQGVALLGLYSDANPQGSTDPKKFRMDWMGGDYMEHNGEFAELLISCYGSITLQVQGSKLEIAPDFIRMSAGGGELVLDGKGATVTPDVIAQNISLVLHEHEEVKKGSDRTGRAV